MSAAQAMQMLDLTDPTRTLNKQQCCCSLKPTFALQLDYVHLRISSSHPTSFYIKDIKGRNQISEHLLCARWFLYPLLFHPHNSFE